MKNYWRMKDFSLFSVLYAYVDHSSYQADRLFVQNKVRVKFKGEYAKEESLDRLKSKMLLLGYRDYPDVCSEIAKMIEE